MVRTKGDRVPAKAVGSKAPAKFGGGGSGKKSNISKGKSFAGGNPYHPRETPEWQKPITSFMNTSSTVKINASDASSSSSSSKETQYPNDEENVAKGDNEED